MGVLSPHFYVVWKMFTHAKFEYNLPFFCKFKLLRQNFSSSKRLKSFIASAEIKSFNPSGWWIIRRSFRDFLNSAVVGKRVCFLIFSEWIIGSECKSQFSLFRFSFKIDFSSKYLILRTEFFVGNQSLLLTNFIHFSRRSDFQEEKKMSILFLYWYDIH